MNSLLVAANDYDPDTKNNHQGYSNIYFSLLTLLRRN